MENNVFASLESQLGNDICNVDDNEEIFWLKMSDDYQSKVKAGDLLIRQYRYKDALKEYEKALLMKQDDVLLYIKLGGAYLTLFNFEESQKYYDKALKAGADEGVIAFYLAIKSFLQGDFNNALKNFEKTKANNGEMLISVIYWHTIASLKAGIKPLFLEKYSKDLEVGHHVAYKTAVAVFAGEIEYIDADTSQSSLDAVIILYGIYEYLKSQNKSKEAGAYIESLLKHTDVWPCIAYLAAYNEKYR